MSRFRGAVEDFCVGEESSFRKGTLTGGAQGGWGFPQARACTRKLVLQH